MILFHKEKTIFTVGLVYNTYLKPIYSYLERIHYNSNSILVEKVKIKLNKELNTLYVSFKNPDDFFKLTGFIKNSSESFDHLSVYFKLKQISEKKIDANLYYTCEIDYYEIETSNISRLVINPKNRYEFLSFNWYNNNFNKRLSLGRIIMKQDKFEEHNSKLFRKTFSIEAYKLFFDFDELESFQKSICLVYFDTIYTEDELLALSKSSERSIKYDTEMKFKELLKFINYVELNELSYLFIEKDNFFQSASKILHDIDDVDSGIFLLIKDNENTKALQNFEDIKKTLVDIFLKTNGLLGNSYIL